MARMACTVASRSDWLVALVQSLRWYPTTLTAPTTSTSPSPSEPVVSTTTTLGGSVRAKHGRIVLHNAHASTIHRHQMPSETAPPPAPPPRGHPLLAPINTLYETTAVGWSLGAMLCDTCSP